MWRETTIPAPQRSSARASESDTQNEKIMAGSTTMSTIRRPSMALPIRSNWRPHNNIIIIIIMANQSPEWTAMSKLVSQFYAKADAGKYRFVSLLFFELNAPPWFRRQRCHHRRHISSIDHGCNKYELLCLLRPNIVLFHPGYTNLPISSPSPFLYRLPMCI